MLKTYIRTRGPLRTGVLAVLFAALLLGTTGVSAAQIRRTKADTANEPVVTMGVALQPPSIPQISAYIAVEKGFFAQQHVRVRLISMPNGLADELGAVNGKDITFGFTAFTDNLEAVSQGAPVEGVWIPTLNLDTVCVSAPGFPTLRSLIGKPVGTTGAGGFAQLTLAACLAKSAVKESQLQQVVIPRTEFLGALVSGRIAAAVFHADGVYEVLHTMKGAHLLVNEAQSFPKYLGGIMSLRTGYIAHNPLIVEHVLAGMIAAQRWLVNPANRRQVIALAVKITGETKAAVTYAVNYDVGIKMWNTGCQASPSAVAFTSRVTQDQGSISHIPAYSKQLTSKYCDAALRLLAAGK